MDFSLSAESVGFRAEVRGLLDRPDVRAGLASLREAPPPRPGATGAAGSVPDERGIYALIGELGFLAPHWPKEDGGLGLTVAEAAIVAEELSRAGLPDTLHINTIQIVGSFLQIAGTPEQRRRYLPDFAAGRAFASVLYTEPEAGSDLASISTRAVAVPGGFRLSGTKVYSLKTALVDVGLCAARTSDGPSRYDGITVFLVDMRAPGVRVEPIPSLADEWFHRVELRSVLVPAEAVVGAVGHGWSLITSALAMERTGVDYAVKAGRWYDAARAGLTPQSVPDWWEAAGRHGAAVDASYLMALWAQQEVAVGATERDVDTAMAKWFTSEAAAGVAEWAASMHAVAASPTSSAAALGLDSAAREAPGLTISAGTSEVMLQIVGGSLVGTEVTR